MNWDELPKIEEDGIQMMNGKWNGQSKAQRSIRKVAKTAPEKVKTPDYF